MTKKTLFLSAIPMMALPAFAAVSCASTTQMQGTAQSPGTTQSPDKQGQTEVSRITFLDVKTILSMIVKDSKPSNSTEFEELIKSNSRLNNNSGIKNSEFNVQIENDNFFVVNYKLTVYSGTFDQLFKNRDEFFKNETEELVGSWKFPILALRPELNPPINTSETSEASEFYFLNFKTTLFQFVSNRSLSDPNVIQELKNTLQDPVYSQFSYNSNFKMGLKKFDGKVEGDFFVFDYELEAPKGSIWDFSTNDPNQFPPGRETLKGTIKVEGLKD